jgi:hypothetical protein
MLKSPAARYVAHVIFAGAAAFCALEFASNQPTEKAAWIGALAAAARAIVGALTTTNPGVGSNVV